MSAGRYQCFEDGFSKKWSSSYSRYWPHEAALEFAQDNPRGDQTMRRVIRVRMPEWPDEPEDVCEVELRLYQMVEPCSLDGKDGVPSESRWSDPYPYFSVADAAQNYAESADCESDNDETWVVQRERTVWVREISAADHKVFAVSASELKVFYTAVEVA